MKVIKNFLFCNRKWDDAKPTPSVINLDTIQQIDIRQVNNGETEIIITFTDESYAMLDTEDTLDFFIEFAEALKNG